MGIGKGVIIGIGIGAAGILAFAVLSSGSISAVDFSALRELKPIDMTKSFEKDPIAIFKNCSTSMLTDKGRPLQSAEVECYDDNVKWSTFDRPLSGIASFKFGAPSELVDSGLICFACKSQVYKYGENNFQLVLFDEVGEKRYNVKLWELPN